jgi:[acyl-carrier-protein] S-malonyltransferase
MKRDNLKRCFLFPGQGAQYSGMGKDMWQASKAVRELFDGASRSCGIDIPALLFEADEAELKKTENTQVAITAVNLAAWTVLMENNIQPEAAAGFSLGEFSALVAAGVLTIRTVFPMVRDRGLIMARAAERLVTGENGPGMAAVMGLSGDKVADLCASSGFELYAANFNSQDQTVVAGTYDALTLGREYFLSNGAKRWITLKVSGPFHSPLLNEARKEFALVVGAADFSEPRISLISNVTGGVVESAEEARKLCIEQVTSPVQWTREEKTILSLGIEQCIETGPGKVLSGLWKKTQTTVPCIPAGTMDEINVLTEA